MKNKFLTHLTKISMDYVYKIFNVEKVYRDIDDLQLRVDTIEDSDIEDRVSDLEDKSILDFEPCDFVSCEDNELQIGDIEDNIRDLQSDSAEVKSNLDCVQTQLENLQEQLHIYQRKQEQQQKAIEALCMILGKKDILKLLEEENNE